jgi:lipid-A-disaccharide synthase
MSKKILIIAGEASGDLYGACLVDALRKKSPGTVFSGVGGPKMKGAGVEILHSIDDLSIIGVVEIFTKIGVIKNLFRLLTEKVREGSFDLAILVNYPGFNLSFARILKKHNVPVVFYSSPQVWAWGSWRVNTVKRLVDKMIVLFRFEEDFYRKRGVEAEFVGHPLVDIVKPEGTPLGIKRGPGTKVVSLLPGSRRSEVKNLLPAMLGAAHIIHSTHSDVKFLVSKHPGLPAEDYGAAMKEGRFPVTIVEGRTYDCLASSDAAIAANGSVTLEAAILRVPTVITYRLSFINGLLYLLFVRLRHASLVNIIAGKGIMPEVLQYSATPRRLAKETMDILLDGERYAKLKEELESVNRKVGSPGASDRAAEIISKFI